MRCPIIPLMTLWILTGCRDDEAAARAARAAKAADEARIEREVTRRVITERKALADRKPLLHTIRVVGFVVLTGGAVYGLVRLRQSRDSFHAVHSASNDQTLPSQADDHHPVNSGRVLDLHPSSSPTQHRRHHHETPPRA